MRFLLSLSLLVAAAAARADLAATAKLNSPVTALFADSPEAIPAWDLLKTRLSELDDQITVRAIATLRFSRRMHDFEAVFWTKEQTVTSPRWQAFRKLNPAHKMKLALARFGVPSAMTNAEMKAFEQNPDGIAFTRIKDLPLAGNFRRANALPNLLATSDIYFVRDFHAYLANRRHPEEAPAEMGFRILDKLAEVIREYSQNRQGNVELSKLNLSSKTQAAVKDLGLPDVISEYQLKRSSLTLPELTEIHLADRLRRGGLSAEETAHCQGLLELWETKPL